MVIYSTSRRNFILKLQLIVNVNTMQEKEIKEKLKNDTAKAILSERDGVALTIEEHASIVSKIKEQTEKAQAELSETMNSLSLGMPCGYFFFFFLNMLYFTLYMWYTSLMCWLQNMFFFLKFGWWNNRQKKKCIWNRTYDFGRQWLCVLEAQWLCKWLYDLAPRLIAQFVYYLSSVKKIK